MFQRVSSDLFSSHRYPPSINSPPAGRALIPANCAVFSRIENKKQILNNYDLQSEL